MLTLLLLPAVLYASVWWAYADDIVVAAAVAAAVAVEEGPKLARS